MKHSIKTKLDKIEKIVEEQKLLQKEVLSLKEAAEYTGFSKSTLYKMAHDRRISYYKPAKLIFFKRSDLDQYMTSKKVASLSEIDLAELITSKTRSNEKK